MRQVTFSTVREAIRVRYDLPTFSTTTKPATADVNVMINASCQRLSGILVETFGDDYFTKTAAIATVADTTTSSLPTDFYKLRSLNWLESTDNPVEIGRATLEDYAQESLLSSKAWESYPPVYRFQGASTIRWMPTPNAIYSVTCTYVYSPATLSADGDTIDAGPGWEEWLVNDVCLHLAHSREESRPEFAQERADTEARIRMQAPKRDMYAPIQARDVRSRGRYGDGVWTSGSRRYGRWG